ncbi:hypothetical protein DENIS_4855 [Desulfonema ishimotonii]|uniref:Uncharacterized protein n=1 Tax=Desulfonema ishimotonii TaxID=45657 RepID=A0A401G3R3_9BACT|nr:hypothetical protein [Desulfonema ishimotonii]GBC63856.1 hypothetical protein DENIS_4855 [Desulfonema ishimotonii]
MNHWDAVFIKGDLALLIHIRHVETGELYADRLTFNFEACSIRQKMAYMNRKITTGSQTLTSRFSKHPGDTEPEPARPVIRIPGGTRSSHRWPPKAATGSVSGFPRHPGRI